MSKRKILNISLPEELYQAVSDLAEDEKKAKAELAREILREYVTKRERWARIRQWGAESAEQYGLEGEGAVEDIIHQSREENR